MVAMERNPTQTGSNVCLSVCLANLSIESIYWLCNGKIKAQIVSRGSFRRGCIQDLRRCQGEFPVRLLASRPLLAVSRGWFSS